MSDNLDDTLAEVAMGRRVYVWESYLVDCSDCERPSDEYSHAQLCAEGTLRDGWKLYGERVLCPDCAAKYPSEILIPAERKESDD